MWEEDGDGLEYKSTEDLEQMLRKLKGKRHMHAYGLWMLCLLACFLFFHSWVSCFVYIGPIFVVLVLIWVFVFSFESSTEFRIQDLLERREHGEKQEVVPWLKEG